MENLNLIANKIMESNNIFIAFHVSPDGDSIGSSLALFQGLKKLNKNVTILSKDSCPETFKFLPNSSEISGENLKPTRDIDLLITLDTGEIERLNAELDFENKKYFVINLDHHISNKSFGEMNYVDVKASSMAEIVMDLLKILEVQLDKNIGMCLYTSILTDTGGFRHSNVTPKTHLIISEVISLGVDNSQIHREVFENKSFEKTKLSAKVIESMELIDDNICIMYLTLDMLKEFGIDNKFDSAEFIGIGTALKGVEVTVLIKETEENIKVSLRSKEKVDVRKIAEGFGGGGHIKAAGCSLSGVTINQCKNIFLQEIRKAL